MSGDLFPPMDEVSGWENATKRNPLLCYLCNEQFEDPRILPCFHSFCSRCLRGRIAGAKILCPLCGVTAQLKEDQSLPPSDSLLKFLIESSSEEKALCANCETAHSHMFFCNTCTQPLCGRCREETHKARMFSSHEIVLMSKRTKDIHKLCKLHDEPYIMFSTEKKVMLCINCFRDMKVESRSHCVDLETAYKQGCKKLDRAVQALYDLQNSVRDGILLLRVLLEEVRRNAVAEKHAIDTLCDNIQSRVLERKTQLEEEVERQYKAKESLFKAQLVTLTTMLPTIHVNLVTSAAFAGSANKHEFLDLAYSLMGRLTSIVQHQQLFPNQTSNINSDYKAQIAKCLEPLLFPYYSKGDNSQNSLPLTRPTASQPLPMPNIRLELPTTAPSATNAPSSGVTVVSYGPNGGRRGNNHGSKVKFIDAKGVFAEHCVEFDNSHRDLLQKLEKLKSVVQELHRDLTLRRTVAKNCKVSEFKGQVSEVDEQLIQHYEYLDQKRLTLEKHWEESLQRIGNEQELYQAQMSDVLRLKQECQHLKTIVTQLSPFVESISKVTERIVPKLGDFSSSSSRENQIHALFEQINTMQPDSKQRVDAIKSAEEEREMLSANRTNPLDEELIKTKGLLRAPVARRESGSKRDFKDTAVPVKDSAAAKDLEQLNDAQSKGETSAGLTTAEAAAATNPNFDNEASKALKKGDTVTESETGGCGFGLRNIDLQNGLSSAMLNASGGQSGYTKTVNINGQLSKKDETVRSSNDTQLSPRVDETGDGQSTMTINGTVVPPEMHDIAGEQGKAVGVCVCLSDSDSNLLRKGSITSRESQKAAILPNKVQVCDKSCEVFANCETYSSKMPKLRSDQNDAELPKSAQSYRKAMNTHTHVSNGERACENKLEAEQTSSSS